MALAVGIFVVGLALIATDKLHRTQVALMCAALLVVTGTLEQEKAIEAIDFNTIGLLTGMMLIVKVTEPTGMYDYLAIRAGQLSRGRPGLLVAALTATTALLSAFLDNLTTVLLIVPITFLLADTLDIPALPLVIMEIVASNIGGTATLIGDPPNILIAGATGLSFNAFLVHLAPVSVLTLALVMSALFLVYRSRLRIAPENRAKVMSLDARRSIQDAAELRRTLPVLVATIVGFFLHQSLHLEPATVALAGASVILLVSRQPLESSLGGIEWPTLFFFLGLFVMVGALEEAGAIGRVAETFGAITAGDRTAELLGITWVAALGSGLVDNIPFTAAMIPVVEHLQAGDGGDSAHWWALSLGACFGGNATIIAAAANVAASGIAERAGQPISFMQFLRVGVPATLLSLLVATLYIVVRYL